MSELSQGELLSRLEEWRNVARQALANLWIEEDEQAYQQIRELVQKPEVTEEWIEEKANWLFKKSWVPISIDRAKDFIRSLIEEIK